MVASLVVLAVVVVVEVEVAASWDASLEEDVLLVVVVDNVRALWCENMYLGETYDAEEVEDERDERAEREVVVDVVVRVRVRMYRGAREWEGRREREGVEGTGEVLTKRSLQDEGIMCIYICTYR